MDYAGTAIVIIYLVGLVAIGALASRKIKTSEDFLVAIRTKLPVQSARSRKQRFGKVYQQNYPLES